MTLKINFCDFWPGFEKNNLFLWFIEKYYRVNVVKNPDYLFFSVHGNNHLKHKDCIKVFFTGENMVPDFNLCDYALGFHYIDFGDRYLRFPLYVYYLWHYSEIFKITYDSYESLYRHDQRSDEELLRRKFCNFVYSNNLNSDPLRDLFFHQLNRYKKVDAGGKHLNNIGEPIIDKMAFIKDYKFTIAFENSSVPGYTTEKLIEPIIMKSLPVYYGNPLVCKDFNIESFIQVKGIGDFDRAIEEIIFLDKNHDIYIKKLKTTSLLDENYMDLWESKLMSFLQNIFDQPLSVAGRRPDYGFNKSYVEGINFRSELMSEKRKINYYKANIKNLIRKFLFVGKK